MGVAVVIDILLATYQGERFLPALLDSLRTQVWKDFRVIAQDDGSTDATLSLLADATADARFSLGNQQAQHLGAIGNFLSLMGQSDAPYCALCDQDDVWLPNRLSAGMTAMHDAEAKYGKDTPLLIHSDCRLIDAEDNVLSPSFFARQGWNPSAVTLPQLLVQNNATGCTMLLNAPLRALVTAHADSGKLFMHDWFIAKTAAAFGQVICLQEPLVCYRQHGSNVMGASRQSLLQRGLAALRLPSKAHERLMLTYQETRHFLSAYDKVLSDNPRAILLNYLSTEHMNRIQRFRALQQGGYWMQSSITRLGQIIF